MREPTQRELRNASAAVMDAVGAELRPVEASSFAIVAKAKAAFARPPAGGFEALRADADAVNGRHGVI